MRRPDWWPDGASLAAVAGGGAVGAVARSLALSAGPSPWTTLVVNVTGCAAIGVLMVLAVDRWPDARLLRPLLGTGVLGGYTTFSTFAADVQGLVGAGRLLTAAGYLVLTPVLCLLAVTVAVALTRSLVERRSR